MNTKSTYVGMNHIKIITGKMCGLCKVVKSIMDKHHIQYTIVDSDTIEGKSICKQLNARNLPVIIDKGDEAIQSYVGSDCLTFINQLAEQIRKEDIPN